MTKALLRTLPLLAPIALAAACTSATARSLETEPSNGVCESGRAMLIVRNGSGREIEIVESGRGGSTSVVAVVSGGSHEVPVRNLAGLYYLARPVGSQYFLPRRDRTVRIERTCR